MRHIDTEILRVMQTDAGTLVISSDTRDGQPVVRMVTQDQWSPTSVTHVIELDADDAQRVLEVTHNKDTLAEIRIRSGHGKELMVQRASSYDEEGIEHLGYKVVLGPEGTEDWHIFVDASCELYVDDDHLRHFQDVLKHCIERGLTAEKAQQP